MGGGLGVFVAHWGSWHPGVLSRDERAKQGSSKAQQRLRNGRMGIKRRQRAGKEIKNQNKWKKKCGVSENIELEAGTEAGCWDSIRFPSAANAEHRRHLGSPTSSLVPLLFHPPPKQKPEPTPHFFFCKGSGKGETCLVKPQRERQAGRKKQRDLQENTEGEKLRPRCRPTSHHPPPCRGVGVTSTAVLARAERGANPRAKGLPWGGIWGEIPAIQG